MAPFSPSFSRAAQVSPPPPAAPPVCDWAPPGERIALHDGDALAIAPAARLRET